MEVGHRDRSVEDADGVVVPGVFSFGEDPVHGARGFQRVHVLAGAVLCWGGARAV
jgi:phosphoribosylformylglycinamidine (FGAM) synthase-like amidotransferase family enzyme